MDNVTILLGEYGQPENLLASECLAPKQFTNNFTDRPRIIRLHIETQ
jgi:hypothetical protein